MNKNELIAEYSTKNGVGKSDATKAVESLFDIITSTLKGRVLPIGGLKEKLLAAIRYGIKTVIIPKENEKDLSEIQKDIQNKLVIKKVEYAREVLDLALDGKISKINKKLDWRHLVSESMKPKNQQNQEKTFVN